MGIAFGIQSDHSKSYTLNIKVPNPIVTFPDLPPNGTYIKELQADAQTILQSSLHQLPSNFWTILQKLFLFFENSQSSMKQHFLKYSSVADAKDIINQLSQLEFHMSTLSKSFQMFECSDSEISEENRQCATSACQEILRYFSDETGIFFTNYFRTTPCLITFAAIYQTFVKFCGQKDDDGQQMALLQETVKNYEQKCIQERIDNIKMLRTQTESFNLHDYSYEAQIRKDVTFGGKINDFYDKRPIDTIIYRDHPLNIPTDADRILNVYRNEVRREYELFFESFVQFSSE